MCWKICTKIKPSSVECGGKLGWPGRAIICAFSKSIYAEEKALWVAVVIMAGQKLSLNKNTCTRLSMGFESADLYFFVMLNRWKDQRRRHKPHFFSLSLPRVFFLRNVCVFIFQSTGDIECIGRLGKQCQRCYHTLHLIKSYNVARRWKLPHNYSHFCAAHITCVLLFRGCRKCNWTSNF